MSMSPELPYDSDFFAKLWQIEDQHFWFKARNQVILDALRRVIKHLPQNYRVLEVGCGTGNVLRHIEQVCSGGQVIGLDLFLGGLRFAQKRVSCPLVEADIRNPPFKTHFNLIGIFDVLEHLPDDHAILNILYDLLAPNGYLIMTVPANRSIWSYFDEASHHCRRYQKREVYQKLIESGFDVVFLTYFMASIFPLAWLGRRLIGRRRVSAVDLTSDELRIVPILNNILSAILLLEARLIKARVSLPVGTSLIAVAKKPAK